MGLQDVGFSPQVLINDVQSLIDEQMYTYNQLKFQPKEAEFNYSRYHTLNEVNEVIDKGWVGPV